MSKSGLNDFLLEVIHNESVASVLAVTEKNLHSIFRLTKSDDDFRSAVTEENLTQCFKYTREIVCCFDGDKAGEKAAWQGVENIMKVIKDGDIISFVFLPDNNDPDNIIEKGGKKLWEKYVEKKVSIEEFIYNKFSKESDLKTAAGKTQYIQKVESLLDKLQAKILKRILSDSLKDKVGAKFETKQENIIKPSRNLSPKTTSPLQKSILILMHHPDISIDEKLLNDSRIENNAGIILLKSIFKPDHPLL